MKLIIEAFLVVRYITILLSVLLSDIISSGRRRKLSKRKTQRNVVISGTITNAEDHFREENAE